MSDVTPTTAPKRALFMVTEVCGRQLLGYCEVDPADEGSPVSAAGFIVVWEPLVLSTAIMQGPGGAERVTNVNRVTDIGWVERLHVRASSYTVATKQLRDMYEDAHAKIKQEYTASIAAAANIHISKEVSAADIEAARAVEKMKVH